MQSPWSTVVVGPFQCNCRILACPRTGEAAVIDPGDEPGKILAAIEKTKTSLGAPVRVKYLLHTHAHLDHIGGTRDVRAKVGGEIALHKDDEFIYKMLKQQGALFGMRYEDPTPVEKFLVDGEELRVGDFQLSVIHNPGHSPGGISFKLKEDSGVGAPESVFTGDTLFAGSVGRTDLWGGDMDLMIKSIRTRLLTLDGDTLVCPGHGPDSRIGVEKRSNPFLA